MCEFKGQAIELCCDRNPYNTAQVGSIQVYPLQLIYADIAWYLLVEHLHNQHLELIRVDRLQDMLKVLSYPERDIEAQLSQINCAHRLLQNGWGLYLGTPQEQKSECNGSLALTEITVRFFAEVVLFILEGEKRHPNQIVRKGPKAENGYPRYVDYTIKLPPRSINEFSLWVNRFMDQAQVLAPQDLAHKHYHSAQRLFQHYRVELNDNY